MHLPHVVEPGTNLWGTSEMNLPHVVKPGTNPWGTYAMHPPHVVEPGTDVTFTFTVTAPAIGPMHRQQVAVVRNGVRRGHTIPGNRAFVQRDA